VVPSPNVGGRHIQIFLYFPFEPSPKKEDEFVKRVVEKIFIWFSLVGLYSPARCSQNINLYLYLVNVPKLLPIQQGKILQIEDVNTAFTFSCPLSSSASASSIYIFRMEEWFKVLIHETFHNLGLDYSGDAETNGMIEKSLRGLFPAIKSPFDSYESYCEVWAELLNVILLEFLSIKMEEGSNDNLLKNLIKRVERKIQGERKHSFYQSSKILRHYGMRYIDLLDVSNDKYNEKTQVFSYYILKNFYFYHLNEFLEYCYDYQNMSLCFSIENREYFIQFLRKIVSTKIIKYYNRITGKRPIRLNSTLRMSKYG
jgi:hypothetical protein